MNTPIRDEIRSRIPKPRAIEDMIAFAGSVESVLRRIINDLPQKRDWLDPQLEREAKFILQANAQAQIPRTQDVANTTDSPERLSAAPCSTL
jgi:hypothetical protein